MVYHHLSIWRNTIGQKIACILGSLQGFDSELQNLPEIWEWEIANRIYSHAQNICHSPYIVSQHSCDYASQPRWPEGSRDTIIWRHGTVSLVVMQKSQHICFMITFPTRQNASNIHVLWRLHLQVSLQLRSPESHTAWPKGWQSHNLLVVAMLHVS